MVSEQQGWAQPGTEAGPQQDGPPQQHGPVSNPAQQAYPAQQPYPAQPHPGSLWGPAPGQTPVLRPGIVPLRPLSPLELYDGAFQALRANPKTMLGVTAVAVTALALVDLLIDLATAGSLTDLLDVSTQPVADEQAATEVLTTLGTVGVGSLVSMGLNMLVVAVLAGVLTLAVSQAVLGRKVPLGELWQQARGRLLPLVGLTLLVGLAVAAVVVAAMLPGFVLLIFVEPVVGALLILVGLLGAFAGAMWLSARLALATPALMLEGQTVLGAWRRSWQLSRGSFWRVLGIILLTGLLTVIAVFVVAGPFQVIAFLMAMGSDDVAMQAGVAPVQLVLVAVGQAVSSTIVYPFSAAVTALLYVDLRMRREGLDVQLTQQAQQGRV